MSVIGFSPEAISDLESIGDYIAQDNPHAAIRFVKELRQRCERIAHAPKAGVSKEQFGVGYRSVPFRNYVIFYRIVEGQARIERIIHGARDIDSIFAADDD